MDERAFSQDYFDDNFLNIPYIATMEEQQDEQILTFPSLPLDSLPATPPTPASVNSAGDPYLIMQESLHNPPPVHANIASFSTPSAFDCSYTQEQKEYIKDENEAYMSGPQLTTEEITVNLAQYVGNETPPLPRTPVLPSPLYLSLNPLPGAYNLTVSIPESTPTVGGVKQKWCYSSVTNKLYAAKCVTFPVNIKLERFLPAASLVICPVYSGTSVRTLPVDRCYFCKSTDQNPKAKNHIIQIEGSYPNYFFHDKRYMVSLPLPSPAPGNTSSEIFLKMTCNTSCVGGPCRRPFSILIILVVNNADVGRQVIHTKCCQCPNRDMNNDEVNMFKSMKAEEETMKFEEVREIASNIAIRSRVKAGKTTKLKKMYIQTTLDETLKPEEFMRVPLRFQKKVRNYINMLYTKEQSKKIGLRFKLFVSETDSE